MINLYTTYYVDAAADRRAENEYCLTRNLACSHIDRVFTLNEGGAEIEFIESSKLTQVPTPTRTTFEQIFALVKDTTAPHDINIVANTDIFFDQHLARLSYLDLENTVLALTRWDVHRDGPPTFFLRYDSQDSWIFQGPLRRPVSSNYPIGLPGCDRRLAYELKRAGYRVINPSLSIKTFHVHASGIRPYVSDDDHARVPPPHAFLLPDSIDGTLKHLLSIRDRERYLASAGVAALRRAVKYDFHKAYLLGELTEARTALSMIRNALGAACNYHYLRKLSRTVATLKEARK